MAQVTDYVISNGSGSAVRADINNVFAATNSSNSGTSAPSSAVPGSLWFDTSVSPAVLKRRNAANTAWVEVSPDTIPANNIRGNSTGSAAAETNVTMAQLRTMLGWSSGSGYVQLPTGLIIQYFRVNFGPLTNSGNQTITFPTTFPTSFVAAVLAAETGNNTVRLSFANPTTANLPVNLREDTGVATSGFINCVAFGF